MQTTPGWRRRPGSEILTIFGAGANRDSAHYRRPHAFEIGRAPQRDDFSSVMGARTCIGQSLARAEIEEVVRAALGLGSLRLDPDAEAPHFGPKTGTVGQARWSLLRVIW